MYRSRRHVDKCQLAPWHFVLKGRFPCASNHKVYVCKGTLLMATRPMTATPPPKEGRRKTACIPALYSLFRVQGKFLTPKWSIMYVWAGGCLLSSDHEPLENSQITQFMFSLDIVRPKGEALYDVFLKPGQPGGGANAKRRSSRSFLRGACRARSDTWYSTFENIFLLSRRTRRLSYTRQGATFPFCRGTYVSWSISSRLPVL